MKGGPGALLCHEVGRSAPLPASRGKRVAGRSHVLRLLGVQGQLAGLAFQPYRAAKGRPPARTRTSSCGYCSDTAPGGGAMRHRHAKTHVWGVDQGPGAVHIVQFAVWRPIPGCRIMSHHHPPSRCVRCRLEEGCRPAKAHTPSSCVYCHFARACPVPVCLRGPSSSSLFLGLSWTWSQLGALHRARSCSFAAGLTCCASRKQFRPRPTAAYISRPSPPGRPLGLGQPSLSPGTFLKSLAHSGSSPQPNRHTPQHFPGGPRAAPQGPHNPQHPAAAAMHLWSTGPLPVQTEVEAFWYLNLTPEQAAAYERFREHLTQAEALLEGHDDRWTLLRFLKARQWDVERAAVMYGHMADWRRQHKPDELFKTFTFPEIDEVLPVGSRQPRHCALLWLRWHARAEPLQRDACKRRRSCRCCFAVAGGGWGGALGTWACLCSSMHV